MTAEPLGTRLISAHRHSHSDEQNASYWKRKTQSLALALLMVKEPQVRTREIHPKTKQLLTALDSGVRTRHELYAAVDRVGESLATVTQLTRKRYTGQ